jgi:hypothetical protein
LEPGPIVAVVCSNHTLGIIKGPSGGAEWVWVLRFFNISRSTLSIPEEPMLFDVFELYLTIELFFFKKYLLEIIFYGIHFVKH